MDARSMTRDEFKNQLSILYDQTKAAAIDDENQQAIPAINALFMIVSGIGDAILQIRDDTAQQVVRFE